MTQIKREIHQATICCWWLRCIVWTPVLYGSIYLVWNKIYKEPLQLELAHNPREVWYIYLSHGIIDSFPRISNWKIIRWKSVLLASRGRRFGLTKLVFILGFLFQYLEKIVCNSMLYMIFQSGWEPVLVQRILKPYWNIIYLKLWCLFSNFVEISSSGWRTLFLKF